MANCNCATGIFNSGLPSCGDSFGRIVKMIFVNYYTSTGVKNSIGSTTLTDQSFLEGKINQADRTQRWFPSGRVFNVEDVRADDVVETIENIDFFVENGVRTFTGYFVDGGFNTPAYLKFLNSLKCGVVGVYYVSEDNKIVGHKEGSILYPFLIQSGSVKTKSEPATSTTVQKNMVMFTLDKSEEDVDFGYLPSDGADFVNAKGLTDVILANGVSVNTTTLEFDAYLNVSNNARRTGFPTDKVTFYNATTTSTIVPLSSTLVGTKHTVVFDAGDVTSADIVQISVVQAYFEANTQLVVTLL